MEVWQSVISQRLLFTFVSLNFVFQKRLRLFFIKSRLSLKVVFPSKFVLHQSSSSIKGCLPSKIVFHQRSSSVKGHLPSKVVFCHLRNGVEFHQKSIGAVRCSLATSYDDWRHRLATILLLKANWN